jgi:ribosomal protein S18 acetylase RimI-like enzyme
MSSDWILEQLEPRHLDQCLAITNQIIEEGDSFPWDEPLSIWDLLAYYREGDAIWCVVDHADPADPQVLGLVHIHPNNVGRCGHIANCGYSVRRDARGLGVGRMLVEKSIEVARELGFRGMQFNAVVSTNTAALALYESFGFELIGTVPGGFRLGGTGEPARYIDMHILYRALC